MVMKSFKVYLHSCVDLITNSSTVIFTYSNGSLDAVKELVNEILKVFGRNETFDDIFYGCIFLEEDYHYFESDGFPDDLGWDGAFDKFKLDILTGKITKPEWMVDIEDSSDDMGMLPPTVLQLYPKDECYAVLAKRLVDFLYSTNHDGYYMS